MIGFTTEQRRVCVGDLEFGGQPGERPPVLVATAFVGKRYWTMNDDARTAAFEALESALTLAQVTGVPFLPDVAVRDLSTLPERIEVVSDVLPPDAPFSVDIPDPALRPAVLEHLGKSGLLDRTIYNSLNIGITKEEREALASNTPAAAIVLAFNPADPSTDGRLAILEDGAKLLDTGLLAIAEDAGIDRVLLDTGATPFGTGAAECLRAIPVFKSRFGLPVGCALHNTLHAWGWMRGWREGRPADFDAADAAAAALPVSWGADLVLTGRVENTPLVYPPVAFTARLVAEGAEDYFGVAVPDDHPARRLP
ncbi:MAG: hypothetical protein QF415_07105 [Candidatus Undinarchaeales archaeon]|jgi:tetrahydromethanopterin S-methyltransferase subunit H|nr:hypothetical protein [Candidatus Undinarchaeales archaeon]MDP7494033.1 hypothetical protein [Candidatus Undinarchaeales archaeon]